MLSSRPLFVSAMGFALMVSLALPLAPRVSAYDDLEKDEYVELIVSILRSHVSAIRKLTETEIKYGDNVVRHTTAIKYAFGMLGPMEWHAAESMELMANAGSVTLSEAEFDELANASRDALEHLRRAADRYNRDQDSERLLASLNGTMQSCSDCHSKLPKDSVPPVWKGLLEKSS